MISSCCCCFRSFCFDSSFSLMCFFVVVVPPRLPDLLQGRKSLWATILFHGQNDKRFLYQFISFRFRDLVLLWWWLVRTIFIIVHTCFMFCRRQVILLFYFRSLLFLSFVFFFVMFAHGIAVHSNHYPFLEGIPLPWLFVFWKMTALFIFAQDIEFINFAACFRGAWPAQTSMYRVCRHANKWHMLTI